MVCIKCNDTGTLTVSYASAENGPTDDPADETGIEFCDCEIGHAAWAKDAEKSAMAEEAYFQGLREDKHKRDRIAAGYLTYDEARHDPDSVFFDNSYTGPSELELGGGCNRCGAPDDCYCNG